MFHKITAEYKDLLNSYINEKRLITSDYALPVILTWDELYEPEIAEYENSLFIRGYFEGKRVYYSPLSRKSYPEAINDLESIADKSREEYEIILALKEQIDLLDRDKYDFFTSRNFAEYVYLSEDLISLKGKKYHAKRNHINKFESLYDYEFRSYEPSDTTGILKQLYNWAEDKEEEDIKGEINIVKYLLDNIESHDIFADVIVIDGVIAGASIGECSNPDMGVVMYEKCDLNYEGIYSAINQMFAEKHFKGVKYINRQEDLGIPGLRQAKQSYNPDKLVYKYTVRKR